MVILGVTKDEENQVASFLEKHQIKYPILLDLADKIHQTYQVPFYPSTYLFGVDGNFIQTAPTEEVLLQVLKQVRQNQ